MEVTGKIETITSTKEYGSNGFRKRELVLKTEEQYPQHLLIEFIQDKVHLLDSYKYNDKVTIGINLRGRKWVSPQGDVKYFNTIQGWKITKRSVNDINVVEPTPVEPEDDLLF